MDMYPKLTVVVDDASLPPDFDAESFEVTLSDLRSFQNDIRKAFKQNQFGAKSFHLHADTGPVDE